MKKLLAVVVCVASLASCNDALTLKTENGTKIKLEVAAADIVHVRAVPQGTRFSKSASLCVLPQADFKDYKAVKDDAGITVTTDSLRVAVDRLTGQVRFYDREGNILLAEHDRQFTPITVEGKNAFTVRQIFESPSDECFYGLGQHQAGEWNYKGLNEELYQYNTKISLPFVVSTKGYGLLWDSYSFCRWGDPRDFQELGEVFTLRDADGNEGSLTGIYTPAEGEPVIRAEKGLSQEFLSTPKCDTVRGSLPDFKYNGSKVLYEGTLEPKESGIFNFRLYYAGYTKLFLDGREIVPEIWRTAWNPNSCKFSAELTAGKPVALRIEWRPDGDVSYCSLKVLSPVDPQDQARQSWWGEMQEQIDYWFVKGADADGVIRGYRTLTGKAPIPPKWAMGYWQSKERFTSQEEILNAVREFRERHIPLDNIVQDWRYWKDDQWGSHEFDPQRYPDPAKMVEDIHSMDCRYMISVWPKFYEGTDHFKEFDRKGWMYRTAVDEDVKDWLGFSQSFYDAYSDGARKLFWEQMKEHLYGLGVDSWWMDASEPNIHDCTDMDYRKKMCGPTALGPSTQYFNAYALMNAQAIYEGQKAADPDRRVFMLTRNGFPGLQRYGAASWSGDIGTRWEDMKTQISAGLNYSISGIPMWGQDIGGFSVENRYMAAQGEYLNTGKVNEDMKEWRELQARWYEYGVFVPLFRAHGQWPEREPWKSVSDNDPAYDAIVESIRLRYTLMPYIYTMAGRLWFDDYTIMRPLVMDFASDATARGVSDEFMFGDALLVCPVCEYGCRSREVYLPEGGWYEFYSGKYLEGGCTIVTEAPFNHIPLFVRAGSILPMGPDIEWVDQDKSGKLILRIYDGGDAKYSLYEDDGVSCGYEKGQCSRIPMTWNSADRCLCIGGREGSFEGMPISREIGIELVTSTGKICKSVTYDGSSSMHILPL